MTPPRKRRKQNRIAPGTMAFAQTWPAWEHDEAPAPHPVLLARLHEQAKRRFLVLPITTKPDLGQVNVPLRRDDYPTAFNCGPLTSDQSVICLKDGDGDDTAVWFDVRDSSLVCGEDRHIELRNICRLTEDEWQRLRDAIRSVLRQGGAP